MDRIKARIALFLVAAAVATLGLAASPARAAESCHPMPQAYCSTMTWVIECVWWRIEYGASADWCRA